MKCTLCKLASSAAKWHCPSGLRWHHCPTHRPSGFLCSSKPRSRRTRITKRTFPGVLGELGPVPRPSNNALQRPSISQAFVYPSDPYHLRRTKRQCSARLTGQLCVDGNSNYSERASYGDQRILPAPCMQLQYTNTNAPAHNVSGLPCSHCWKRGGEITGLCICDDIAIAALNHRAFQAKLPRQLNAASGASQRSCHRMACEATTNAITEKSSSVSSDGVARLWKSADLVHAVEGPACYASSLLTTTVKSTSLESSPSDANGFSDPQGAALSVSSLRATKTNSPFWSTDRQNVPSSNPSLRATGINMPSSWCEPPLMHPRRVPPDLNCGVSAVASTKDQTRTPRTNEPPGLEPPLKQPRLQIAASKPHSVEDRSGSPIVDIPSDSHIGRCFINDCLWSTT